MKKYLVILATVLMGVSCSKFDDSALNKRIDDLDDRVDSVEQELKELRESLKATNDAYKALTWALNGGVIQSVTPTADGYDLTVMWMENGQTRTETYHVKNGEQGVQGETGNGPELTVELDPATGRYYWCMNGEPMEDPNNPGEKVWATGEKGADGAQGTPGTPGTPGASGTPGAQGPAGVNGKTPTLAVGAGEVYPGDGEGDGKYYWWVSYDEGADFDTPEAFTWSRLVVYDGTSSGDGGAITVEYDKETGKVIFKQNGVTIADAIVQAWNGLGIEFDGVEEYGTLRFYNGEEKEVSVTISGATENAVVKAELQNNNGTFAIEVDDDNNITVTALKAGVNNKLLVEVLDGKNCYHTYVNLVANIPVLTIPYSGAHHIYFEIEGTYQIPIELNLDIEATEDITIAFEPDKDNTIPSAAIEHPANATILAGQSSTTAYITITRNQLSKGTAYTTDYYSVSAESGEVKCGYPFVQFSVDDVPGKVNLTADSFNCPFDGSGSGEGQGVGALIDGDPTTMLGTFYWNDNAFTTYATEIAIYGVYVDVTLPSSVLFAKFRYQNRNGLNGQPRGLKIGASNGGDFEVVCTKTDGFDTANSAWNETEVFNMSGNTPFSNLRFGVTNSQTQQANDLTTNPAGSMTLAELEVYVLN